MKRLLMAIAMTFVLSVSALAGEIPCDLNSPAPGELPTGGISSPIPTGPTSPGDVPTGGFAGQVSDTVLSALLSVFAW